MLAFPTGAKCLQLMTGLGCSTWILSKSLKNCKSQEQNKVTLCLCAERVDIDIFFFTSRKAAVIRSPSSAKKSNAKRAIILHIFYFLLHYTTGKQLWRKVLQEKIAFFPSVWEMNKKITNVSNRNKKKFQTISAASSRENISEQGAVASRGQKELRSVWQRSSAGPSMLLQKCNIKRIKECMIVLVCRKGQSSHRCG